MSSHWEPLDRRAAAILASLKATSYEHQTCINASQGIYRTDCSGFISYLIAQVAPERLKDVPKEPDRPWPRAFKYYRFLRGLANGAPAPGWQAVTRLAEARPGDLMAWELEAPEAGADTGHVMIIAAPPCRESDVFYRVRVIDASAIRHDEDLRPPGGGLGQGTIRLTVSQAGSPTGFQFNPGTAIHSLPVAIGRILTPERMHGQE